MTRNRGIQRTVRGYATRIEGTTKFRFVCPARHVTVEDINKGRPKHLRIGELGIALFARYWSDKDDRRGGVSFHCAKCFAPPAAEANPNSERMKK